ncbi:MAG: flippase [Pyrinomonadaceae bacterium]|nr:flippase [Sphingobacteriaceae bacterium]
MNILHKGLATNFFSLSLVQVANSVLPIITFPIVARIIGPEKFGAINFAGAAVTYFTLLINYGFDLSSTRTIAKNKDNIAERDRVFSEVLFAKLLLLILSIVIFIITLLSIPQFWAEKKLFVFTFLTCFSAVITPNWFYQGMQQLYQVAIFNFITKLLFTISIIFFIKEQGDYVLQPLILGLASILTAAASFIWAVRKYSISIHRVSLKKIYSVLWTEKMIFFSGVVINLYTTTNIIMLGLVQTTKDVAFFSAASKMIIISQTLISMPLSQALFPVIGESFGQGRLNGIDKLKRITPFITVFTFTAGILLWFSAPLIIQIFFGSAFGEAVIVLRILSFVPLIIAISDLLGIQTMINLNMDKAFFKITSFGALFGLLLNFFFSKNFGAQGTAWAWVLSEIVITFCMWLFLSYNQIQLFDSRYFRYNYFMEVARPFMYFIKKKVSKS